MTQFTFPTNLADHLQQEIYTKLVAEVQSNVDRLNTMWAKREQEGKTFHTKQTWHGEEKVYCTSFQNSSQSLSIRKRILGITKCVTTITGH